MYVPSKQKCEKSEQVLVCHVFIVRFDQLRDAKTTLTQYIFVFTGNYSEEKEDTNTKINLNKIIIK